MASLIAAPAFAGATERDKAWDALIAAAKSHRGSETKLDGSASYVFKRPDGSYLSFTRLLNSSKNSSKGRSVCLIAKDENATACVDWDTGKLTLGSRADPAAPWKFRSLASLDAFEAEQPGLFQKLLTSIQGLVTIGGRSRRSAAGGYRRYNPGGSMTSVQTSH
jgi:hypothetical protein